MVNKIVYKYNNIMRCASRQPQCGRDEVVPIFWRLRVPAGGSSPSCNGGNGRKCVVPTLYRCKDLETNCSLRLCKRFTPSLTCSCCGLALEHDYWLVPTLRARQAAEAMQEAGVSFATKERGPYAPAFRLFALDSRARHGCAHAASVGWHKDLAWLTVGPACSIKF